jgi:hypothetical protein
VAATLLLGVVIVYIYAVIGYSQFGFESYAYGRLFIVGSADTYGVLSQAITQRIVAIGNPLVARSGSTWTSGCEGLQSLTTIKVRSGVGNTYST